MSKSFSDNYFDQEDTIGNNKKSNKKNKTTRQKIKNFLKHIEEVEIDEDFDVEQEVCGNLPPKTKDMLDYQKETNYAVIRNSSTKNKE